MKNKRLNLVAQPKETCFNLHDKHGVLCQKKSCENWVAHGEGKNCVLITSKSGPKTLQEIGQIYGLTRMRICQIEKVIYEKVKNLVQESD